MQTVSLTPYSYNMLRQSQRKVEKGVYYAQVNGEWRIVKFVKP